MQPAKVNYSANCPVANNPFIVQPNVGPNLTYLRDLSTVAWPHLNRPNITTPDMVGYQGPFDIKFSRGHRASLEKIFREFEKLMIGIGLHDRWFLAAGSLLGSVRHHDVIPWDEDADVFVDIRHRPAILSALKRLPSEFRTYAHIARDKIYLKPVSRHEKRTPDSVGGYTLPNRPWGWPFLDICYFKEIGQGIALEAMSNNRKFHLRDIYPLVYRPFGKHWFPAPRRSVTFLSTYYPTSSTKCSTHSYSHAAEKPQLWTTVDCRQLLDQHTFVQRCPLRRKRHAGAANIPHLAEEHLVDSNGRSVHVIQTIHEPRDLYSAHFSVKPDAFVCP